MNGFRVEFDKVYNQRMSKRPGYGVHNNQYQQFREELASIPLSRQSSNNNPGRTRISRTLAQIRRKQQSTRFYPGGSSQNVFGTPPPRSTPFAFTPTSPFMASSQIRWTEGFQNTIPTHETVNFALPLNLDSIGPSNQNTSSWEAITKPEFCKPTFLTIVESVGNDIVVLGK